MFDAKEHISMTHFVRGTIILNLHNLICISFGHHLGKMGFRCRDFLILYQVTLVYLIEPLDECLMRSGQDGESFAVTEEYTSRQDGGFDGLPTPTFQLVCGGDVCCQLQRDIDTFVGIGQHTDGIPPENTWKRGNLSCAKVSEKTLKFICIFYCF